MRKRVTFVEQLSEGKVEEEGRAALRSPASNRRRADGCEFAPQRLGETRRAANRTACAGSQYLRTVHVPRPSAAAPFLEHPGLTVGQKRYLCSIASVYSTEHMRQQMKGRDLGLLHACLQQGQRPARPCRRRSGPRQCRDAKDAGADAARSKPQGQKKDGSSADKFEVKLPKIVNR